MKSNFAAINARHRIRCTTSLYLLVPELITATTAALSHRARTDFPLYLLPHKLAATTIGMSSLIVMW